MDTKVDTAPADHVSDADVKRFRAAERSYLDRHPDERWEVRPRNDDDGVKARKTDEEKKDGDKKEDQKPDQDEDKAGGDKKDDGKSGDGKSGNGKDGDDKDGKKAGMSRGRKILLVIIAIIIAVCLIVAGWLYYDHERHFEKTDDAFIDAHVSQVAARVGGQIESIAVDDNQHVEAGQPILQIDKRDYQIRVDQAVAQHDSAVAQQQQAEAQLTLQQANIDQANANVSVAQADLVQAQQDYARFKNIDPKAITKQQLDNADAALKTANARLQSAVQAVAGTKAQYDSIKAQVTAAKAQVENADAGTDNAKLQLSYASIIAPITGRITRKTAQVGNYINPGVPLLAIVPEELWITANYKETQLQDMKPGQGVDIKVDAFPKQVFKAKVDSIQRGSGSAFSSLPAENATGNYVKVIQRVPVKIIFTDDEYKKFGIAPGMSVQPAARVR